MGWYGKYIYSKPSMREVRKLIEEDIHCTCVAVRLGYAICVVTRKDILASRERALRERVLHPENKWQGYPDELENLITIVLWKYYAKDGEFMTKTMEESVGPCIYDVPMKYLKAECKAVTAERIAHEQDKVKHGYYYWREKAIAYMENKSEVEKRIRKLKRGDVIKTKYKNEYTFEEFAGTHILGKLVKAVSGVAGQIYRIPKGRIIEVQAV